MNKALELFASHSKSVTLGLFVLGLMFLSGAVCAQSGIEGEVTNFANTLLNILHGPLGKVLAMAAFIGCGISLFTGRYGIAVCCFLAGILFGFAKNLAEAVFR